MSRFSDVEDFFTIAQKLDASNSMDDWDRILYQYREKYNINENDAVSMVLIYQTFMKTKNVNLRVNIYSIVDGCIRNNCAVSDILKKVINITDLQEAKEHV